MIHGEVSLVFPHQLFLPHPALCKDRPVYLIEEYLFLKQYAFHKQKLVLHRASMQYYREALVKDAFDNVEYVECSAREADARILPVWLAGQGITTIHVAEVSDDWLYRRLTTSARTAGVSIVWYASPNFLNSGESAGTIFKNRKTYFQTDFYTSQRKQRKLLLEPDGSPAGGKWTFDTDNRERFPKGEKAPGMPWPETNAFVKEARLYSQQHFPKNPGTIQTQWFYPTTHQEAEQWLRLFLEQRLSLFGRFEDAMVASEDFLYHSVLTPMLNIGLLSPQQVVNATIEYATLQSIPMNSLEGFIRQIVGWREFIHLVYLREGRRQRTTNFWGFSRKIPASFYDGSTGIAPVDAVIKKLLKTGYNHHIERLMVLGNFMLLCEFDPNEVYRWFMEMYIDAYDWVMVPNIYGMTQFADGGLMTTKPYISGSNYLMKMGDWPKGDWQATWDGLFWRFMHVHRHFFTKNPRLGMLVNTFDKMDPTKRQNHLQNAEIYLAQLEKQ